MFGLLALCYMEQLDRASQRKLNGKTLTSRTRLEYGISIIMDVFVVELSFRSLY